jgi:hypothetical protein
MQSNLAARGKLIILVTAVPDDQSILSFDLVTRMVHTDGIFIFVGVVALDADLGLWYVGLPSTGQFLGG